MHNYKALKAASKASVQKVKVVESPAVEAVAEVKDDDGVITTHSVYAQAERSHEELQVVCKSYNSQTGEAQDDSVRAYSLSEVKREVDHCKSQVARLEAEQAEWEQLETDLKAL
jgi:DNA repair exonuclease SbcCD ATPase subunit